MAEKVEIIIEADDQASKTLEDVNEQLENLGSIATGEALARLGEAGIQVFEGMAGAVSEFVGAASEAETVQMRMQATLKALGNTAPYTADQINTLATELAKISGFDDEALVQGMSTLSRFGSLSTEQFETASRAATDLAAITGMDLASAFRQVGMALDNPEQGFGRLKRQIGDLTDAEKEQVKALVEMGDTAAAQALILEALAAKTQGAAEMMGDTFAGKVAIANTNVGNLKESLGGLITGPLAELPQGFFDAGVGVQQLGGHIANILGPLANFAIVLGSLGKGGGLAMLGGLFAKLGVAIKGATAAAGAGIAPIVALGAAIAVLIKAVEVMGPYALQTLKNAFAIIKAEVNMVGTIIKTAGKVIGEGFARGIGEGFKAIWTTIANGIKAGISTWIGELKKLLGIGSPSQLMANQIGKPMAQGVALGFQRGMGGLGGFGINAPAFAGAGGGTTVVLNYSPGVAIADQQSVTTQLVPYIRDALRRL